MKLVTKMSGCELAASPFCAARSKTLLMGPPPALGLPPLPSARSCCHVKAAVELRPCHWRCVKLSCSASYHVLQSAPTVDDEHAAVGGLYAHATAPLRRLADRYLLEGLVGDEVSGGGHAIVRPRAGSTRMLACRAGVGNSESDYRD